MMRENFYEIVIVLALMKLTPLQNKLHYSDIILYRSKSVTFYSNFRIITVIRVDLYNTELITSKYTI